MFCNDFSSVFRWFCKCFRYMFQVFSLSDMYIANVLSGCFKDRLSVAHVVMTSVADDNNLPQGFGSYLVPSSHGMPRSLSPLSPLPSLPSILSRKFKLDEEALSDEFADPRRGGGSEWADGGVMPVRWRLHSKLTSVPFARSQGRPYAWALVIPIRNTWTS